MNRIVLLISPCVLFLGCELQQNPKPYEFKEGVEDAVNQQETKPSQPVTSIGGNPTPPRPPQNRQDPNKSFNDTQRPVVRGAPRHDFPESVFPE